MTAMFYDTVAQQSLQDIFHRVAKLDVHPVPSAALDDPQLQSLTVTTQGDYQLTMSLSANRPLFTQIATNMKHGNPPSREEVSSYTAEFFNILCGHIISAINRAARKSARFGIPVASTGLVHTPCNQVPPYDLYYQDIHGLVLRLRTACKCASCSAN